MVARLPSEIEAPSRTADVLAPAAWALPSPLTSFIGRGDVLDLLDRSFASGDRMVTILGPPGIGKTRLAAHYAGTRRTQFREGNVWFCDLTLSRRGVDAMAAVSATLGIRAAELRRGEEMTVVLARSFAARARALLVLDNFEQLAQDPDWVGALCAHAPELRILITSRERLRLGGEKVIELDPLELPRPEDEPDAVLRTEAGRLFVERASGVFAHDPSDEDKKMTGALVRALEGIPLAIELAAARTRTLGPADILARLTRRFDVLKAAGPASQRDRHATLERAIEGSWNLLEPWEQSALAQCSVFAGGFSLDAAERVLKLDSSRPVVEVLEALCDKSLVTARPSGTSRRFGLYVSIREYARGRLNAVGRDGAIERHANYYLTAGEAWADAVDRRADISARDALRREQENLSAIYRRSASPPHTASRSVKAIRAILALYPALESGGPIDELVAVVEVAGRLSETPGVPSALRARALFARGCTYGLRGRVREALVDLEDALRLAESAGDEKVTGEALVWLSVRYRHAGRFTEALEACHRAHALLERTAHTRMMGLNLAVRGRMRGELGQREEARKDNERAKAIFREIEDRWAEGLALANLGQLDAHGGDLEQARWYFEQALIAFRETDDPRYEGIYLAYLGCLDWETGDVAGAKARLTRAISILEELKIVNSLPLFRAVLGGLLAELGYPESALAELDRASSALADATVPAFAAAMSCHRGHLDLARARGAATRGDERGAARLREAARARVIATQGLVEASQTRSKARLVEGSDDLRFAVRMLERALDRAELSSQRIAIEVEHEARWFAVGSCARVDLTRRGATRLILKALIDARVNSPGLAVEQDALLRAGWPGERILREAGSKRVRVAIATLRRLGLKEALVTGAGGYLLAPHVSLRVDTG
jgi:predicted ATPase